MDNLESYLGGLPSLIEEVAQMPIIPIPSRREPHPFPNNLAAFARGTSRQSKLITDHLAVCPNCRAKVEQIKAR